MTAPNRRWFRGTLWTLFVVIALVCVWFDRQVNTSLRRQEAMNSARHSPHAEIISWAAAAPVDSRLNALTSDKGCRRRAFPRSAVSNSVIRRWMGDEPIGFAVFYEKREFESFSAHFPEATVLLFENHETYSTAKRSWGL